MPIYDFVYDFTILGIAIFVQLLRVKRKVPKVGLEPTHPHGYQILSLARLPFRHFGFYFFLPQAIQHGSQRGPLELSVRLRLWQLLKE